MQKTVVSTPRIPPGACGERAYVLLDVRPGCLDQALRTLLSCPGVAFVDQVLVQGPPDLIVTAEAPTSQELVLVDPTKGKSQYDQLVGLIDFGEEAYVEVIDG